MNLTLDPELVKTVVAEAILKSLDEQKREVLIKAALTNLLAPSDGRYGSPDNITSAFNYAVRDVAQKIASEMLLSDESVKEKIRGLINEATTRLFETNREQTVTKLADAIAQGLAPRDRY